MVQLATVLASEGGTGNSEEFSKRYVTCGVKALANVPPEKVKDALEAADAPARWAILGSDALDAYVKSCRETDQRLGPPNEGRP